MRSDGEKLLDILEATDRIERYVVFGRERFERDELVQTWFIQNLQIIGEACRSLSQNTRDLSPTIPWKQIIRRCATFTNPLTLNPSPRAGEGL